MVLRDGKRQRGGSTVRRLANTKTDVCLAGIPLRSIHRTCTVLHELAELPQCRENCSDSPSFLYSALQISECFHTYNLVAANSVHMKLARWSIRLRVILRRITQGLTLNFQKPLVESLANGVRAPAVYWAVRSPTAHTGFSTPEPACQMGGE